ncbi:MAG: type IV pilus assembly protein PilM [Actinomycetota bacterium]|nr:type IV pilus assembly protein PilM [Actinomycetota bacterium]
MARQDAVGLDIGTHSVNIAQISTVGGTATLTNFGGVTLPPGAVREGEVVDVDVVAAAIDQLWSDAGISERRVHLGVANRRVVVGQVDLPAMEEAELRSALRSQVQDYSPTPVEEAALDFHRLEEFTGEDGSPMVRLLFVAAHRDMVSNHISAVMKAGLEPEGVDLNAFAVLRALVPDPDAGAGSEMLVDIGAGVTNIIMHEHGIPRFVRVVLLGGGDITETIASDLSIPEDHAEAMKIQLGLRGDETDSARTIEKRADQFIDEVRGALDHYLAQTDAGPISRLVLSGGGSKLLGLCERMTDALLPPVVMGHPLATLPVQGTVYGPDQLAEVEPVLTTAIGLALVATV